MAYKFDKAYSQYGSSMGRKEYNQPPEKPRSIQLFRVYLDNSGYDNGGAYWGIGAPLYCAMADEDRTGEETYRAFTRAYSRREAMENLGIKISWLISKKNI